MNIDQRKIMGYDVELDTSCGIRLEFNSSHDWEFPFKSKWKN